MNESRRETRRLRRVAVLGFGLALPMFAALSASDPPNAVSAINASTAALEAAVCEGHDTFLFCGELTGDCQVSASDALAALRMAVGAFTSLAEADMDSSGSVTTSDALKILRIAVGTDPATNACDPTANVTLDAVASGFYSQTGSHEPDNYAVGWYGTPNDDELRDYFVFDLAGNTKTIGSAVLRLTTAPQGYIIYGSDDPSETYTLFGVTTEISALTDGSAGTAAFDDLADGETYGSQIATSSLGKSVDIPLNAAGLALLNASTGQVAFGGAITTLAMQGPNEFLFNATSAALTRRLILTLE